MNTFPYLLKSELPTETKFVNFDEFKITPNNSAKERFYLQIAMSLDVPPSIHTSNTAHVHEMLKCRKSIYVDEKGVLEKV